MIPERGTIEEYEQGAWVADLVFSSPPDGKIDLWGETWVGTVLSSRQDGGRWRTRIIGGAGGLTKLVRDRQYSGAQSISKIAGSILSQAGEIAGSTLTDRLENYLLREASAGQALDGLTGHAGVSWRLSRVGKVDLYRPASGLEIDPKACLKLGVSPSGSVSLAVASSSSVQIGQTFEGKRIRGIRWHVSPSTLSADVDFSPSRLPDLSGLDLLRIHSAKVERQNADGSLDLIVSGKFGLAKVPFLSGLPGSKVTLVAGDLVSVGFFKADSRSPYAMSTGQASGSTAGVAREGDSVDCGTLVVPTTLAGVLGPIPFQITYVPPGPTHTAEVAAAVLAMAPFAPTSIDLVGVITSGYARVKFPAP
jgi:hypothetical protein